MPNNPFDLKSLLADPDVLNKLEAEQDRRARNRLDFLYPDTGLLRRELYVKHVAFFEAGAKYNERCMLGSNKSGKTTAGAVESSYHATGRYPAWWKGKRFDCPTVGWVCNNTNIDCRDINQLELLGPPGQFGTGTLPYDCIINNKPKPSVPDAVETTYIRHSSGGQSMLLYKAYEQGREKFQGRNIHWIWADEEVPSDIYTEMFMRIMTTNGIIFLTYTPLLGLTPVTVDFLTNSVNKSELPLSFTGGEKLKTVDH